MPKKLQSQGLCCLKNFGRCLTGCSIRVQTNNVLGQFFSRFSIWHDSWPARKLSILSGERKEPQQQVLPSGFATRRSTTPPPPPSPRRPHFRVSSPATRAWLLTISPRESFLAGYVTIIKDLKQQECRLPGRQKMASGQFSILQCSDATNS